MRIRTRIIIGVAAALVVVFVTVVVVLIGLEMSRAAMQRSEAASVVLTDCFELSMLTTDYLVSHQTRAERQWLEKHRSLGEQLVDLEAAQVADAVVVERITTSHAEVRRLFEQIVQVHARTDVDPEVNRLAEDRLSARLLIAMQTLVSDTALLGRRASQEALGVQTRVLFAAATTAIVAVGLMLGIGAWSSIEYLRPLSQLQSAVRAVGLGDLGTRSGVVRSDELGELAYAFDTTVGQLRESYEMLQDEVHERRMAEAALQEYRDHLETLVDERTEELLRANEDLVQATRAKDDFLTAMSHELRTPLNSIIGFTEIMLQGLPGEINAEQERQLTMVRDSGKLLLALIDDVLDIARINAGRISVAPMEFSLRNAIDRVVEMMHPMAKAKELALTVDYAKDSPDAIVSDRGKVDQILLNLLANAVTYTDKGGVTVSVRAEGGQRVAVAVTDTGLGIPEEDLEKIFEQFHRAHHDLAATHPGTGLGLPISRRLAEALGGSLSVRSVVGEGSTFTVVLPVDGSRAAQPDTGFPDSRE